MDELKQRILEGVKGGIFAFEVYDGEVYRYFETENNLKQWASDNAIVYVFDKELHTFFFAISPSLSAIKAGEKGMRAMADALKGGN